MKALPGIFIVCILIGGLVFFVHYKINFLWYVGLVGLIILGFKFINGPGKKRTGSVERKTNENLGGLKAKGEAIRLDFDRCEFQDSSYSLEINVTDPSSVSAIVPESDTESVNQSLLIFNYKKEGIDEKFTQAFPFSSDTLKFYVLNNNITLYIDWFDRSKYFFDLKA